MNIAAHLGLSGTRGELTPAQLTSLTEVLVDLVVDGSWDLHHTDEVGAAAAAHAVWRACRQHVTIHPSTSNQGRALCDHDVRMPQLAARERDIQLAHATEALVLVPGAEDAWEDQLAYRSARRLGRPIIVVHPSGHVQQWTHGLAPIEPDEALVPPGPDSVQGDTPQETTE